MGGMASDSTYRSLSYWLDSVPGSLIPADPLPADTEADVAIAGAGFTGLWTAYYLARAQPGLRIVVCEAGIAGFGASGRNGGWCSALFPASLAKLARQAGRDGAIACHRAKGGTGQFARTRVQLARARSEVAEAREIGFGEQDLRLLTAAQAREQAQATDVLGATYTPHCAAIHPARLVRGLAEVVRRRGVAVHEATPVTAIEPGLLRTTRGVVRARHVIRATEGYTPLLPGLRRAVAPVYSLMIATEPLPEAVWAQIGLAGRATFGDLRHLVIYGQRTADGRLAFGGRGAPYHLASAVRRQYDRVPPVFAALRRTLEDLFPVLTGVTVTHTWGGPLGITRDWCASAGLDPVTGVGWAGGYVGDGVATTNLAGRTLADLILGADSVLTRLPWVNLQSPRWEHEPLRWLGVNAGLHVMTWADRQEARTGRPSRAAAVVGRFLGG